MWHWKHILICLFLLTACSQKKSSEKDDVDTTNLPDRSTDNLPTDTNPPADSQTVTAADTVNDTQTDTNNDTAEDSVGDTQTATDTDTASGTESDTQPDTDSGNGSDEDSDVDTGTGSDSAPDTATGDTDSTTSSASDSSTETEALLPCIEVDRARAAVFAPAAVRVTFRVLDCDGYPIRKLTADDVTVVNSLTGEDFNASLSGGGASAPEVADNYGFYTVLALDMSDSIFAAGSQNDVLDSAKLFVQNMVTNAPAQLKHKVAILVFGQTTATEFVQDFTGDSETLNNALDVAVASGARGSTNLYGAFQQAIDAVTSRGTELNLVERTVVILTDDTHETENEENLRIQALLAKNYAVSNFNTNVFSVGIDGSYDESKLSELASRPDYFIKAENAAALSIAFEEVVAGLQAIANSNYVVGVCTPVAEGAPSLMVNVTVDGGSDSAGLSYSAEPLTGDLGACDPATVAQPCLDLACGAGALPGFQCGDCFGANEWCDAGTCIDDCGSIMCGLSPRGSDCGTCNGPTEWCNGGTCVEDCDWRECGTSPHGFDCGTCAASAPVCAANLCTAAPIIRTSCADILNNDLTAQSGTYTIDPDGNGVEAPFNVYCDMDTLGGGWTAVAIYGMDLRPTTFTGDYPRAGASFYGTLDERVFDANINNDNATPAIMNWSVEAKTLWENSDREIMAYVGGTTDDYIYTVLPLWSPDCNFFDISTWCIENQYNNFSVYTSGASRITNTAVACTTAHRNPPFENDYTDETGFILIDGPEPNPEHNCGNNTNSAVGHQNMGRIFQPIRSASSIDYWSTGVHSHWNETGSLNQPGALLIR